MGKSSKSSAKASSSSSSSTSMASRSINGFQVLPLDVSSKSFPSPTTHYLYLRADKGKSAASSSTSSLPSTRTLFVVNLPVDTTERHLRSLFEKAGRIESVKIKTRGFRAVNEQEEAQVEEEDVDDSEMGDDSDEEDQKEQEVDATSGMVKSKRQLRREAANKPKIPELHSLPSVNPRREHVLLRTGSTAHVVFLEEGSVEKALKLAATKPSSFKWTDPWVEMQKKLSKANKGDADEDDSDEGSSRKRRKQPTTALEAQKQSLLSQDPAPKLGLSMFIDAYHLHRPSLPLLKKHADSVVSRYTFFRSHPQLDPANQKRSQTGYGIGSQVGGITIASWGPEGEPLDSDGFTIVLPGGKYGRSLTNNNSSTTPVSTTNNWGHITGHKKMIKNTRFNSEEVKAKKELKSQGLEDFYRFQNREKRKEKLIEMRKQFEADREKIQKLKEGHQGGSSRRFKPY
ncbi:unnamed protein product [Sympodiomycopsis kandeliae]